MNAAPAPAAALPIGETRRSRRLHDTRADQFRPEIQGMRAVAVLLVVLYHLWPNRLTGGYVGVDVFFVLSGYLITAHIVREVEVSGTLRVGRFWARRVRRLLPASLLVLAVSGLAVYAYAPATLWAQTARQLAASALYVQNWALALDSVDYMAADNVPTVAQHYWSLSVEEQFYLLWPLLVLVLVLLSTRLRFSPRGALVGGIGAVVTASLVWSVVSTYQDQAFAYLSTLTRAWEFGAGALTALLATRPLRRGAATTALGWLGLAAVVTSGVLYTETSLFPGWIAVVPVLGTVAMLVAGRGGPGSAGHWLSRRPATFIGDISYSVYLWHWPLVLVVPFVTDRDLTTTDKVSVLGATLLLAWMSTTWVENPLRRHRVLAAASWRAFAFALVGMGVILAGAAAMNAELQERTRIAEANAERLLQGDEEEGSCAGPAALAEGADCDPVTGTGQLAVPPEVVAQQKSSPPYPGCQQTVAPSDLRTCDLGDTTEPVRTVALVGDSHATHWFTAFDEWGKEHGWRVVTMTKTSCPLTQARRVLPTEQTDEARVSCEAWVDNALEALLEDDSITDVYVSAYSSAYGWESAPGTRLRDPGPDGFAAAWRPLLEAGKRLVVLAAVPRTTGQNVPDCLDEHDLDPLACSVPRAEALPPDVMLQAAASLPPDAVTVVDLSDRYCDATTCYPVVGDVIVYLDYSHLTKEYSVLLLPALKKAGAFD